MKAFPLAPRLLLPAVLLFGGCRAARESSPSLDVLGSYFPAWIVCIVLGLVLTVVTRQLLIGFKLNDHLHPAPLVYLCMTISYTLAVWLVLFKN
jgi:hypothetical protein